MCCSYGIRNHCHDWTTNRYSLRICCCCVEGKAACYWIGVACLIWGIFEQVFDYTIAFNNSTYECIGLDCFDRHTNSKLSLASGIISSIHFVTSFFFLIGIQKESRLLILTWLIWSTMSLVMPVLWLIYTAPYMPNFRGFVVILESLWVIYFIIVVKTYYTQILLTSIKTGKQNEETPLRITMSHDIGNNDLTDPDSNKVPFPRSLTSKVLLTSRWKKIRVVRFKQLNRRSMHKRFRSHESDKRSEGLSNKRHIIRKRWYLREKIRAERLENQIKKFCGVIREDESVIMPTKEAHGSSGTEEKGYEVVRKQASNGLVENQVATEIPTSVSKTAVYRTKTSFRHRRYTSCLAPRGSTPSSSSGSGKRVHWSDEGDERSESNVRSELRCSPGGNFNLSLVERRSKSTSSDKRSRFNRGSEVISREWKPDFANRRMSYKYAIGHDTMDVT